MGSADRYGEGTLLKGTKAAAFYKTTGASVGLQAGAQQGRLRVVPDEPGRRRAARRGEGVRSRVGPSFVLIDEGMAKSMTTTTMDKDIYAFILNQGGLMAGLGIQGNKVTKITPK